MSGARIAMTHASGLLAEAVLDSLSESGIPPDSVVLLDVPEQAGQRLAYAGTHLTLLDQYAYDYEDLRAILLLQEDDELHGLLKYADSQLISHTLDAGEADLEFCAAARVPADADDLTGKIGLADAETSCLVSVLRPLRELSRIEAVHAVTIQSASMLGKSAVDELATQTIDLLNSREVRSSVLPMQLAFNMLPLEVGPGGEGLCKHLEIPGLVYSRQRCVVAAFHGLMLAVTVEFGTPVALSEVESLLSRSGGVRLQAAQASPLTDCGEGFDIVVFGLVQPQKDAKKLQFWIIADSIRNGLVKNYQKVIELLLNPYL